MAEGIPLHVVRLREVADQIGRNVLAPRAEEVDAKALWPRHSFEALAEAGMLGLNVPEIYGGHGQGLLAVAVLTETLGRYCSSSAICYGMHCVGTAVIAAKPTGSQAARYLRRIAGGEHVTTLALSEPGTGVHFYLPQADLRKGESGDYLLSGTKHFVTNGAHADSYVVSTRATTPAEGEFSCVIVDADTPGMRWEGTWEGLGMRGNSAITLKLEEAKIPEGNLLGSEGEQTWYVFEVVAPYFLIAMAGTYAGIARAALDHALTHLRSRLHSHSGESLAQVEVLQHRAGALWSRLEASRQLMFAAARLGDSAHPDALPAILSCKAEVADTAVAIANEAMTLAGGLSYRENGAPARFLRDVRASHVMAPTTDILRVWTGRALLGQPLL